MMRTRSLRRFGAALLVSLLAAVAVAQDYTVTTPSGLYVPPPTDGSASTLTFAPGGAGATAADDGTVTIQLPFDFPYFGSSFTSCSVCTNGFIQLGTARSYQWIGTTFPTSVAADDGLIAAYWDDLYLVAASGSAVVTWTTGTSPNRKFFVSWENFRQWDNQAATTGFTFQIQLSEGTGRIVFAYASGGSWPPASGTASYSVGLDAVSPDSRSITPAGTANPNNFGQPASDYQFDPVITNFTGTVLYDRYVVDGTGIGNSSQQNVPLAGLRVELRDGNGKAAASAFCDATGAFQIRGAALVGAVTGSIVVTSSSLACTVKPSSAGVAYAYTLASNVSFGADAPLGTVVIGENADPGGAARAPLHVAATVQGAYEWCAARTLNTIAPLEVLYDTSSGAQSSYTKPAAPAAASMRVSGTSANPDAWDRNVIRRVYARHVLGAIAAHPSTTANDVFDTVSDDQNAFAEGFGYYLDAAIAPSPVFFDGLSTTASNSQNLESPTLTSPMGPNVTGWVAAGLYDLTDAANEAWDDFDGAGAAKDKVFQTVDSLTSPVTVTSFYVAWGAKGFDGVPLAHVFIHYGIVGDDADEPNDAVAEAKAVAGFGFVRTSRILNLYNEDWYQFTVPAATTKLTADVLFDRSRLNTVPLLEIRTTAGAVLATGAFPGPSDPAGPMRAVAAPLAAGTYRIRIAHAGGDRIDAYALQAFAELSLSADSFQPWTVNRPYNVPIGLKGGIPPYTITVEQPFVKPPGLVLDSAKAEVSGTPTTVGTFNFVLSVRDVATPNNLASVPQSFTVNPELTFDFGEFVAFPLGKALDRKGPSTGGTPPYTFTPIEGALPGGVSFAPGEFRFVGNPAAAGSTYMKLEGADVAGSKASSATTAVVCVPFGTAGLALGASACGYWFDAVQGTSVSIKIGTAKKQPKRLLRGFVFAADGSTAVPAVIKTGAGKAAVSGFVAPSTGRFYCVLASDTGDASSLTGSAKVAAPKAGSGNSGPNNFTSSDTLTVEFGALAGATLSFSAKPDKSGLQVRALFLRDPSGAAVTFAPGEVKESGGAVSFTRTLPASGTWKVFLGAKPGPQGHFTYAFKLKEPKGVTYSAD